MRTRSLPAQPVRRASVKGKMLQKYIRKYSTSLMIPLCLKDGTVGDMTIGTGSLFNYFTVCAENTLLLRRRWLGSYSIPQVRSVSPGRGGCRKKSAWVRSILHVTISKARIRSAQMRLLSSNTSFPFLSCLVARR